MSAIKQVYQFLKSTNDLKYKCPNLWEEVFYRAMCLYFTSAKTLPPKELYDLIMVLNPLREYMGDIITETYRNQKQLQA